MEEIMVQEGSPLIDKTLRETGIGQNTGAMVIGINDKSGRTRTNPTANAVLSSVVLKERDVLIVLGSDEQIARLRSFVKKGSA
jgi:K+/H+ antiporter YhaU regulatory subunit KhtT